MFAEFLKRSRDVNDYQIKAMLLIAFFKLNGELQICVLYFATHLLILNIPIKACQLFQECPKVVVRVAQKYSVENENFRSSR